MAVFPRYISAGNIPADGPLKGADGPPLSRMSSNRNVLALLVVQNELRTVRSMGADSPPLKAETGAETWLFCLGCPK